MSVTPTIPLTVQPEAETLLAELGMHAELEQMLEHVRRTIPGLHTLRVTFAPAYDTGEEGIIIEAVRDPAYLGTPDWKWAHFSYWKITTFSPDVCRYFQLFDVYEPNHGG